MAIVLLLLFYCRDVARRVSLQQRYSQKRRIQTNFYNVDFIYNPLVLNQR